MKFISEDQRMLGTSDKYVFRPWESRLSCSTHTAFDVVMELFKGLGCTPQLYINGRAVGGQVCSGQEGDGRVGGRPARWPGGPASGQLGDLAAGRRAAGGK